MKTRNILGGAIVAALLAGAYLGGMFPKFGTGPGLGTGTGESGGDKRHSVVPVSQTSSPADSEAEDPNVLHIRIDGRSYTLVKPDGDQAVTLEQLLEQVPSFTGDRQGTRVRVSRRPSSKTTAEIQLRDALVKAGLSEDEIDWRDGPRP